jgi:ACS family tartrate transporter-like MFS transporter
MSISRKITMRLIPFMVLLYIMSYLDRINVSFAGLEMNRDLGFSETVFGFGAGIFFIGYCLFGVPSNLMVQRLGARTWISMIMIVWGFVSTVMAFVRGETDFYVLRFLLGVAEAGFFPGMILYLTYWFPQKERAFAVGRFMAAIPVAGILGGLISSQVLKMSGFMGLAGWKWLFILTGLPSVFLGMIAYFYLTDLPAQARWLSTEEKELLAQRLQEDKAKQSVDVPNTTSQALRNPLVWRLALTYFCLTLGMYGFQLWLPQIVKAIDRSDDSTTALLTVIPAVFQALGMILMAWHSDRKAERRWHFAASISLAAIGLLLAGSIQNPMLALAALSLTAFGIWGTVGPFWAIPTSMFSAEAAAAGIALINSVGNLGGFAGPYLIGLAKTCTTNFSCSLYLLAVSLLVAGVLVLTTRTQAHT